MRIFKINILVLLILLLVSSCSSTNGGLSEPNNTNISVVNNNNDNLTTNVPFDVKFEINHEVSNEGKLKVGVNSNLPNKTKIVIGLNRQELEYYDSSIVEIIDGFCESKWFSQNNSALSNGNYLIEVKMVYSVAQPEQVQKVIGSNGENLKGQYIVEEKGMHVAMATKTIQIQNGNSNAEEIKDKINSNKQIVKELYDQLVTEYEIQRKNYNSGRWFQFSNSWNKLRDSKAVLIENEGAIYNSAMGDLFSLWQDMDSVLRGKKERVEVNTSIIEQVLK